MAGTGRKRPASGSGRAGNDDAGREDERGGETKEKGDAEVDKWADEGTKEKGRAEQSNENDETT